MNHLITKHKFDDEVARQTAIQAPVLKEIKNYNVQDQEYESVSEDDTILDLLATERTKYSVHTSDISEDEGSSNMDIMWDILEDLDLPSPVSVALPDVSPVQEPSYVFMPEVSSWSVIVPEDDPVSLDSEPLQVRCSMPEGALIEGVTLRSGKVCSYVVRRISMSSRRLPQKTTRRFVQGPTATYGLRLRWKRLRSGNQRQSTTTFRTRRPAIKTPKKLRSFKKLK